jgi:hypothetical protein
MRREFNPLPDDKQYLDRHFPNWESLKTGMWILLPHFVLPKGFTFEAVTAAIQMPTNYPLTELNMVYFHPAVVRMDGSIIKATEHKPIIDGMEYQRWSRHYKPGQWNPEECSLATHVMAIYGWLEKEASEVVAA